MSEVVGTQDMWMCYGCVGEKALTCPDNLTQDDAKAEAYCTISGRELSGRGLQPCGICGEKRLMWNAVTFNRKICKEKESLCVCMYVCMWVCVYI